MFIKKQFQQEEMDWTSLQAKEGLSYMPGHSPAEEWMGEGNSYSFSL